MCACVFVCLCAHSQGYLWKKGHLRRNWTERWFSLRPSSLVYFVSEDSHDCKGLIELDLNCCVEVAATTNISETKIYVLVLSIRQTPKMPIGAKEPNRGPLNIQ